MATPGPVATTRYGTDHLRPQFIARIPQKNARLCAARRVRAAAGKAAV